ncbi:class I SAM-dependent methyltransferase [Egicoccus sp. AB-alg2]|uniref:class I SAM-dependent methyltransferase n=1 Tax=Egicoccus sp. AB-alg2 TaxID=3242693 RepID=UPI00359DECE4
MTQGTFRPSASTLADHDYLDYVEGVRKFAKSAMDAAARAVVEDVLAEHGEPVRDVPTLRALIDPSPVVGLRNRLLRSQQEMMWRRIHQTLDARRGELLAELEAAEQRGPGSVHWDPDLAYPEYFTSADIHLQPESYEGDDLAGYIYHYGTNIFYVGRNDDDRAKQGTVDRLPLPEGPTEAVLDLACSIGQSTTALKKRLPEARVTGIDLAAPMVRYAHLRASTLGIDVDFRQESAADLSFEDGTFDLVYCNILFHEVPRETAEQVVAEAHRVLRNGGMFIVQDFGNRSPDGPMTMQDYTRNIDTNFNGEPFASRFVYSDFLDLLRATFADVDPDASPDPSGIRQMRVCRK